MTPEFSTASGGNEWRARARSSRLFEIALKGAYERVFLTSGYYNAIPRVA